MGQSTAEITTLTSKPSNQGEMKEMIWVDTEYLFHNTFILYVIDYVCVCTHKIFFYNLILKYILIGHLRVPLLSNSLMWS